MEICCIYKGKHTVEVELGGLLLTGTREIHVATHCKISMAFANNTGGGSGLLLCVRDQRRGRTCRAGGRVRSAPQGQTYCSWRSHMTRGAVVRCAMCGVCRCAMCVVCRVSLKIKKVTRKWSTGRRCADARAAAQRQRDAAPHRCAKKRAVER